MLATIWILATVAVVIAVACLPPHDHRGNRLR
jgi:hypothetical protein